MYAADDSDDDAGHPGCVDELDPPEPYATARGPPPSVPRMSGADRLPRLAHAHRELTRTPAPSVRPENRWGADPRLLQYRAAPPPRDDPTAIRGTLPAFGTARRLGTAETSRDDRNGLENRTGVSVPDVSADEHRRRVETTPSAARGFPRHPMYPMLPSHSTQHNAHLLGNPLTSMRDLPEHTKRLLFAQAMLNKQRLMNDECERLNSNKTRRLVKETRR
jgi:hypothetical protein